MVSNGNQRRPTSTPFIDSYSQSGTFGSTVYNKEFCWKQACKPESIRTGTASGQRRNNPHPSQSFMMCRLPMDSARSPEYVRFPCKCPPSEVEVCQALAAQYHSTYRWDFMGMPQDRRLAALHSRPHARLSADTEMRDNYREPKPKPELLCHHSQFRWNKDPNMTCRGIVPTVVQRHTLTQQKRSDLTTYDRFCGKRISDVTSVVKSLLPQELQQLCRILPEEDKEAVKRVLSKDSYPNDVEKGNKLPAVSSCTPEWISRWAGPL